MATSHSADTAADIAATRAFFGPRAAGWEERFPDDEPAYTRAVADLGPPPGGVVLDVACGTGRALPILRFAVGPRGTVIGVDLTAEMLAEARRNGRTGLVLGDARALPLRSGALDAVFAAGLLPHVRDTVAVLAELRRVCRPGGRLALFHPISRATLAGRHGRDPNPDDVRAEPNIRRALAAAGWTCELVDDGPDRYLVTASARPAEP